MNINVGMTVARVRDFRRMNPPKFYGFKVEEVPQESTDKVYNILAIMEMTLVDKAEQDSF